MATEVELAKDEWDEAIGNNTDSVELVLRAEAALANSNAELGSDKRNALLANIAKAKEANAVTSKILDEKLAAYNAAKEKNPPIAVTPAIPRIESPATTLAATTSTTAAGAETPKATTAEAPRAEPETKGSPSLTYNKPTVIGKNAEDPIPNPLRRYVSYTYSLMMEALNPTEFNAIVKDATKPHIPKNVVFASAGRYNTAESRNQFFRNDFFFEKLEFTTIIGSSASSRNSNAVLIQWTVVEPYGMTLFDNLTKMAREFELESYVDIPYMITVDFYGYDEFGIPNKIPNMSKFIPVHINQLKMKISTKGAEYEFQATLFSHQAFSQSISTTPANIQVTAQTVEEFFLTTGKEESNQTPASGTVTAGAANITDGSKTKNGTNSKVKYKTFSTSSNKDAKSYTESFNKFNKDALAKVNSNSADIIKFEIDEEIANSSFHERDFLPKQNTSMGDPNKSGTPTLVDAVAEKTKAKESAESEQKKTQAELDKTLAEMQDKSKTGSALQLATNNYISADKQNNVAKQKLAKATDELKTAQQLAPKTGVTVNTNIAAEQPSSNTTSISHGTTVMEVINLAITNSEFIHKQVLDTSKQITRDKLMAWLKKPLIWFKITTKVELGSYDKLLRRYQKTITYRIDKFATVNYKDSNAPKTEVPAEYVCKKYNYIFTGKNEDVLNFDLQWNTQYFTLLQAKQQKIDALTGAKTQTGTEDKKAEKESDVLTEEEIKKILNSRTNGTINNDFKPKVVIAAGTTGTSGTLNSTTEVVKQLQQNVLTTPGGDMINVKLRIVGDPDFIKQDDVIYGIEHTKQDSDRQLKNGSLITDAHEIFARLTFNTPTDYGQDGVANVKSSESITFSGLYRIVTVKSFFEKGKFEQELSLIRLPDSAFPSDTTNSTEGKENKLAPLASISAKPVQTDAEKQAADQAIYDRDEIRKMSGEESEQSKQLKSQWGESDDIVTLPKPKGIALNSPSDIPEEWGTDRAGWEAYQKSQVTAPAKDTRTLSSFTPDSTGNVVLSGADRSVTTYAPTTSINFDEAGNPITPITPAAPAVKSTVTVPAEVSPAPARTRVELNADGTVMSAADIQARDKEAAAAGLDSRSRR